MAIAPGLWGGLFRSLAASMDLGKCFSWVNIQGVQ